MEDTLSDKEKAEIEKAKIEEFERMYLWAINWKHSADKLRSAADVVVDRYNKAVEKRDDPTYPHGTIRGQNEYYDLQLIQPYYFLMGLAIENLVTGIAMQMHPENLALNASGIPEKEPVKNVKGHNSYVEMTNNHILGFDNDKDLLEKLGDYVVWMGRYPAPLRPKDMFPKLKEDGTLDWREMPLNPQEKISDLYKRLYYRLELESLLRYLKDKQVIPESFDWKRYDETIKEMLSFMVPETGRENSLAKTIKEFNINPILACKFS